MENRKHYRAKYVQYVWKIRKAYKVLISKTHRKRLHRWENDIKTVIKANRFSRCELN
jgi:hypothetical protein